MSLSAVKYRDGIEISFSPQCKHFHLLQASEGRGSHICDRSIGPNALGRSNQSPRHAIVGAERRPDPRLFPPLLFHPSWLCPSPPFFPPSILLSAGRRWVMPLAGRLKLSPSSSKYIFSIPLLPCLFYVSFSPSSLTLLSARRHHLFLDISRLCSVAPVGALPWFFCFSPSVWKSDSSAVYVSIILSFSPSLSPTVHPAVLTLPCLLAVMMWTHILFTLPIYCVYTLL